MTTPPPSQFSCATALLLHLDSRLSAITNPAEIALRDHLLTYLATTLAAPPPDTERIEDLQTGAALITAERTRQIHDEGWTPEHDHGHDRGQLIDAALSYLRAAINAGHPAMQTPPQEWPWEPAWWKPADHPIRNLVKAGALIAAEIDRLTHTPPPTVYTGSPPNSGKTTLARLATSSIKDTATNITAPHSHAPPPAHSPHSS